mgnify:CR=1 FL=1
MITDGDDDRTTTMARVSPTASLCETTVRTGDRALHHV